MHLSSILRKCFSGTTEWYQQVKDGKAETMLGIPETKRDLHGVMPVTGNPSGPDFIHPASSVDIHDLS